MLEIENLGLSIGTSEILKDVSMSVKEGQIVGIVGESGSGKSLTALSTMQLLPDGSATTGSIRFHDAELLNAPDEAMQKLRGDDLSMIFQEPMTALNPVKSIGDQIAESITLHTNADAGETLRRTETILERVGLPPRRFPLSRYPHQLSGGQRQRVMIAMACVQNPAFLIADEPTTALDVTLQKQILELLKSLVDDTGMGLILISHDLAVVAETTDEIVIMRNGEIVDKGPTGSILRELRHPYTAQLAQASAHIPTRNSPPVLSREKSGNAVAPLLRAANLFREYPTARKSLFQAGTPFRAVDDVSMTLYPGQSMGLVGESGCGKSTLARMILALDKPNSGAITFADKTITGASASELTEARRNMQVVFQDPYGSFNPRHKVERFVAEPLYLVPGLSAADKRDRVAAALQEVGIGSDAMAKYAHEFSGGQRQRLAIARALITRPALIVADEPVSALDVSIRAQVLDLLSDLRERLELTYLFISHDLGVVRAICDEVLVMDEGKIMEHGPVSDVFDNPKSAAAQQLVDATPDLKRAIANRSD